MSEDEVAACLQALMGGDPPPQICDAKIFANDVLGFEEYDESTAS